MIQLNVDSFTINVVYNNVTNEIIFGIIQMLCKLYSNLGQDLFKNINEKMQLINYRSIWLILTYHLWKQDPGMVQITITYGRRYQMKSYQYQNQPLKSWIVPLITLSTTEGLGLGLEVRVRVRVLALNNLEIKVNLCFDSDFLCIFKF